MDLRLWEGELKKRWAYPYRWRRMQNDRVDSATRFIYRCESFAAFLETFEQRFGKHRQREAFLDYSLNRWYNFWSAQALETIFCMQEGVVPARNRYDRLEDFRLNGVRFDHKTSVFPRGFGHTLTYAVNHPQELIAWLYRKQSQQGRKHFGNRLFVVLYAGDGEHWKLKAELVWLARIVRSYVAHFDPERLYRFNFVPERETLSGIIWALHC